jgi:uncharacterized RDD family membrane protein YckC
MSNTAIKKQSLQGYYAGFVSRFIAFILDIALINIVLLLISWFVSISLALLHYISTLGFNFDTIPYIQAVIDFLLNPFFIALFVVGIIFLYFTFFVVFSGHTPGKAFMGLRVVTKSGKKLSFLRSVLRFIAYIPTILSLGIGFFWIIFDDQRQAWHDTLSNTLVIYTWDARPDESFLSNQITVFPIGSNEE